MNIQGLMRLVTVPKWRQSLGDITTPKLVVDALLSHLEEDPVTLLKKGEIILDPTCGHGTILVEIANRAKQTMDPMTIAKQLWGFDIRHAITARKLLANELGIDPKHVNIYEEDSLKAHMKIKNFRVVMNPPFNEEPGDQRGDAGNSNNSILYQDFVNKFAKEAKQVVSLNPAGWTIKSKDVENYKSMGVKQIEFLPANHFPTVTIRSGLTISNFVKGYNGDITITTQQGDKYQQARTEDIKNISVTTRNILNKLEKFPNLGKVVKNGSVYLPVGTKGSIERACDIAPTKFKLALTKEFSNKTLAFVGDGVKTSIVWSTDACTYVNDYKVVVSGATSKYFLGNVITVGPKTGICKNNMLVTVTNQIQADLYKEYLDSALVRFIIKNVKFNDVVNTKTNSWNYIPVPPIEELEMLHEALGDDFDLLKIMYGHLDISEEEQKHIEA